MTYAVIGGGVAGLAAAWELARAGHPAHVYEPGRIGGKIRTSPFAGRPVDEGPDAFLVRTPDATDLCSEIGLGDLVAPSAGRTLLWTRGRLRRLPDGLVLGVPGRLGPVIRSGLLGPGGLARAALDLVLPPSHPAGDVSVGDLVTGRFGRQVATRLVEPLLGGIHAASLDELSAELTAPHLLAAARRHRSLLLGLRTQTAPVGTQSGPIFLTPAGGTGRLVEELEKALRAASTVFHAEPVEAVRAGAGQAGEAGPTVGPGGGNATVSVTTPSGSRDYEGVVLAVPAPVASRLLGPAAPAGLGSIRFTSVALLTVSIPASQWSPPAGYNGFLVPHDEHRLMTACSFFTNKWPAAGVDAGHHIVRVSAGHSRDGRVDRLDDAELTASLIAELSRAVGSPLQPAESRLSRWPDAFPLYQVGHGSVVEGIERALAAWSPRVAVAGASYRGAGIPACIKSGRSAARTVLAAGARPEAGTGLTAEPA
ncbi:MAG: protoporphyrinogen oxidase [Acidobacteriota bacterium]|nr:protoporphyrinogen oxidase [Acidobacteriota bacterium]